MGLGVLGAEGTGDGHASGAELAEPFGDELGADGLAVDLLHPSCGAGWFERGNLFEDRLRVVVSGPDTFEVKDRKPAEPTEGNGRRWRHHRVHGRAHDRDAEVVGVDLPRH